jgi:hypothetical protein
MNGADIEQVAQVRPQLFPLEEVLFLTLEAVDEQPSDATRLEEGLEDLEILDVDQNLFAVLR